MANTVNLGMKYAKQVQQHFASGSLLQGRLESNLDFVGARTVRIHTINTVKMNDYDRTAPANRYGVPEELGDSVQELTMTQDKSYSAVIDKGNSMDQAINKAGQFVRAQLDDVIIPMKDRYGLAKLAQLAGVRRDYDEYVAPADVVERMNTARVTLLNNSVPMKGRTWFVGTEVYTALLQTDLFKNIGQLGGAALATGQVGELMGSPVVEVPIDLMPDGVSFMLVHKSAGASPSKIAETIVHVNPPGISGHQIDGRYYWDTFVFGAKSGGIFVDLNKNAVTVPVRPGLSNTGAVTKLVEGGVFRYTTDDTDPMFSITAKETTTSVVANKGDYVVGYQYIPGDEYSYRSDFVSVVKS